MQSSKAAPGRTHCSTPNKGLGWTEHEGLVHSLEPYPHLSLLEGDLKLNETQTSRTLDKNMKDLNFNFLHCFCGGMTVNYGELEAALVRQCVPWWISKASVAQEKPQVENLPFQGPSLSGYRKTKHQNTVSEGKG